MQSSPSAGCIGRVALPEVTPSIAVLPFADLSPGKDQEYFSDGLADEVLDALVHVEGLRVAGRISSFSFKGKDEDVQAIVGADKNATHGMVTHLLDVLKGAGVTKFAIQIEKQE